MCSITQAQSHQQQTAGQSTHSSANSGNGKFIFTSSSASNVTTSANTNKPSRRKRAQRWILDRTLLPAWRWCRQTLSPLVFLLLLFAFVTYLQGVVAVLMDYVVFIIGVIVLVAATVHLLQKLLQYWRAVAFAIQWLWNNLKILLYPFALLLLALAYIFFYLSGWIGHWVCTNDEPANSLGQPNLLRLCDHSVSLIQSHTRQVSAKNSGDVPKTVTQEEQERANEAGDCLISAGKFMKEKIESRNPTWERSLCEKLNVALGNSREIHNWAFKQASNLRLDEEESRKWYAAEYCVARVDNFGEVGGANFDESPIHTLRSYSKRSASSEAAGLDGFGEANLNHSTNSSPTSPSTPNSKLIFLESIRDKKGEERKVVVPRDKGPSPPLSPRIPSVGDGIPVGNTNKENKEVGSPTTPKTDIKNLREELSIALSKSQDEEGTEECSHSTFSTWTFGEENVWSAAVEPTNKGTSNHAGHADISNIAMTFGALDSSQTDNDPAEVALPEPTLGEETELAAERLQTPLSSTEEVEDDDKTATASCEEVASIENEEDDAVMEVEKDETPAPTPTSGRVRNEYTDTVTDETNVRRQINYWSIVDGLTAKPESQGENK